MRNILGGSEIPTGMWYLWIHVGTLVVLAQNGYLIIENDKNKLKDQSIDKTEAPWFKFGDRTIILFLRSTIMFQNKVTRYYDFQKEKHLKVNNYVK